MQPAIIRKNKGFDINKFEVKFRFLLNHLQHVYVSETVLYHTQIVFLTLQQNPKDEFDDKRLHQCATHSMDYTQLLPNIFFCLKTSVSRLTRVQKFRTLQL